jgi:membrane associated rhomboid family serine protease
MPPGSSPRQFSWHLRLPRPGRTLTAILVGLGAIWFAFAVGTDSNPPVADAFAALTGSGARLLRGELWRLFTAPLLHEPAGNAGVGHIALTLVGLYLFGTSLERRWRPRSVVAFLYGGAVAGFVVQAIAEVLLPASVVGRFSPSWFGAGGAVEAAAIAWALSLRGQRLPLGARLPLSPNVIVVLILVLALSRPLLGGAAPEGAFSPAGSLLFGWLAGGGDPPPARRWWLRWRLRRMRAVVGLDDPPPRRLRVIEGGRMRDEDAKPPDKKWLN